MEEEGRIKLEVGWKGKEREIKLGVGCKKK